MAEIFEYGGHGVNIKITGMDPNNPDIAWVRGNSFVMVEDQECGPFLCGTTPVRILSVNGMGEIRWAVDAWSLRKAMESEKMGLLDPSWDSAMHLKAFHHFNLKLREEK